MSLPNEVAQQAWSQYFRASIATGVWLIAFILALMSLKTIGKEWELGGGDVAFFILILAGIFSVTMVNALHMFGAMMNAEAASRLHQRKSPEEIGAERQS